MFLLDRIFQQHKNDRILVVDDEEFCIAAMKALLLKIGVDIQYQVDYCINGLEAIHMIEEIQKKRHELQNHFH